MDNQLDKEGVEKLLKSWLVHDCYDKMGFSVHVDVQDGYYVCVITAPSGEISMCSYEYSRFNSEGLRRSDSIENTKLEIAHESIRRVVRDYYNVPHSFIECIEKLGYRGAIFDGHPA